jgi:hypothetical protein
MSDHIIGPWRSDDWQSFLSLDVELPPPRPPNTLAGLLGTRAPFGGLELAWRAEQREAQLAAAWAARCAHPVYKALQQDLHFRQAWKVFDGAHRRAKEGKLASDTTPFQFLHEYVWFAGHAFQIPRSTATTKYGPSIERRRSAVKHAAALSELLGAGVALKSYSDTEALEALLKQLRAELTAMKRKRYGGARSFERSILKGFAHALIVHCELKSPAVVTHFARMVSVACEPKTAQRYCNEAAKQWAETMADALRRRAAKDGSPRGQNSAQF